MPTQKLFLDSPVFNNYNLGVNAPSPHKSVFRRSQPFDIFLGSATVERERTVSADIDAWKTSKRRTHTVVKSTSYDVCRQRQKVSSSLLAIEPTRIIASTRQESRHTRNVLDNGTQTVKINEKDPQNNVDRPSMTASRSSWSQRLLVVAAMLMLFGGGYVIVDGYRTNQSVAAQATKLENVVAQESKGVAPTRTVATNDTASSTTNSQNNQASVAMAYQVPANEPKFIDIPKLRIHAKVTPQGLDKTGAISVPNNTSQVGWYTNSVAPGKSGAALITGHVSGYTNRGGVFYNLKKLDAGDTITITMGDDRTFTYVVVSKETATKDSVDMTKVLTPVSLDKPGLNLMTCFGAYNSKEQTYDQRLTVYASLQ